MNGTATGRRQAATALVSMAMLLLILAAGTILGLRGAPAPASAPGLFAAPIGPMAKLASWVEPRGLTEAEFQLLIDSISGAGQWRESTTSMRVMTK